MKNYSQNVEVKYMVTRTFFIQGFCSLENTDHLWPKKEVIVVKYSEIQNGKVFRFLQNKHHTHLLAYSKY